MAVIELTLNELVTAWHRLPTAQHYGMGRALELRILRNLRLKDIFADPADASLTLQFYASPVEREWVLTTDIKLVTMTHLREQSLKASRKARSKAPQTDAISDVAK